MRINYQDSIRYARIGVAAAVVLTSLLVMLASVIGPILLILCFFFLSLAIIVVGWNAYDKRKLEIIGMRPTCPSCGELAEKRSTKFCEKCEARIAKIPPEATAKRVTVESPDAVIKPEEVEVLPDDGIETCMVCNLSVKISDLPVWCPHCGNIAHREHLLEWVHVKDKCPKCGAHLNEQEICTEPPRRHGMPKRKKGVWKTV
jgi:predicted RNA-binding Zn-ribbon protein involved in translation (DUF1610 family)